MQLRDELGNAATAASAESLANYERALQLFQCYIGDPVATVNTALSADPGLVMGHVLHAWLHLLGTEPAALPVARESHAAALRLGANEREAGHLRAIGLLLDGHWHEASRALEDVSIEFPRDALALQAGHIVDFLRGDSRMLRDRVSRALPAWSERMPGYHAILGMHAFGLEETGLYARAEAQGRKAVELEPRDGWAQHAVAHVMEMQCRQRDGIAWMRANPDAWSRDSFFCIHNWWHLAVYHLELGDVDEVLRLFDGPIYGTRSGLALDMVDAAALLWRLQLRGIEVGERWNVLADKWEPIAEAGNYAFNDAHAMLAFVGSQRLQWADRVLDAQRTAMQGSGDNATFTREVGHPVTLAIRAFGDRDYGRCVDLLRPVRNIAHRFGGSHAQRDLIDLTLIEAAFRAGQTALAAALVAERREVRQTPFTRALVDRVRVSAKAA